MGKKLYVGNLSYNVTDRDLSEKFAECGTVESAMLVRDRDTGRAKGFGFVEMSTEEEAAKAIQRFNNQNYEGRPMTVNEAKPMVPRSPRDNQRGGGRSRY